jgi:membrane-associated phospholipid phosphatase
VLRWTLRIGGPLAYGIAFGIYCSRDGVPFARERMLIWLGLGLLAFSLANLGRSLVAALVDWVPFVGVLVLYDLARGIADNIGTAPHLEPQIDADKAFGGGDLPTVWLQRHFWHGGHDLHWYDYAAWGVYITHFFATLVVAAILWIAARHLYRRFVAMVVTLAVLGFATYIAYPAVPPWLAGHQHQIPHVASIIGVVFAHLKVADFNALFEQGRQWSNRVAAMPSLHAAESLLIAMYLWGRTRWARPLLALYPPAMAVALVYSAEHWVIDILIGWLYAIVAYVAVNWVADTYELRGLALVRRVTAEPAPALLPRLQPGGSRSQESS